MTIDVVIAISMNMSPAVGQLRRLGFENPLLHRGGAAHQVSNTHPQRLEFLGVALEGIEHAPNCGPLGNAVGAFDPYRLTEGFNTVDLKDAKALLD